MVCRARHLVAVATERYPAVNTRYDVRIEKVSMVQTGLGQVYFQANYYHLILSFA